MDKIRKILIYNGIFCHRKADIFSRQCNQWGKFHLPEGQWTWCKRQRHSTLLQKG